MAFEHCEKDDPFQGTEMIQTIKTLLVFVTQYSFLYCLEAQEYIVLRILFHTF